MAAKVTIFYIFGGDEIDIKESAHLCVRTKRGTFLFYFTSLVLLLFAQAKPIQKNDAPVDVALASSEPDGPVAVDRARSAAERFLFERLESLPTTAGLFELNSTLDIPFGPGRAMEIDLAAHALKLASEVDGYHHFQDEDAYRRDRRKDFLLQGRGYLVVRILAEDVVRRLEDVLDLILEAVASRRRD